MENCLSFLSFIISECVFFFLIFEALNLLNEIIQNYNEYFRSNLTHQYSHMYHYAYEFMIKVNRIKEKIAGCLCLLTEKFAARTQFASLIATIGIRLIETI